MPGNVGNDSCMAALRSFSETSFLGCVWDNYLPEMDTLVTFSSSWYKAADLVSIMSRYIFTFIL